MFAYNDHFGTKVRCYRLEHGDLAYRMKLGQLSPEAKQVLFQFEDNMTLDHVIEDLAWREYADQRWLLLPECARHEAKKEVVRLIAEIRDTLGV